MSDGDASGGDGGGTASGNISGSGGGSASGGGGGGVPALGPTVDAWHVMFCGDGKMEEHDDDDDVFLLLNSSPFLPFLTHTLTP